MSIIDKGSNTWNQFDETSVGKSEFTQVASRPYNISDIKTLKFISKELYNQACKLYNYKGLVHPWFGIRNININRASYFMKVLQECQTNLKHDKNPSIDFYKQILSTAYDGLAELEESKQWLIDYSTLYYIFTNKTWIDWAVRSDYKDILGAISQKYENKIRELQSIVNHFEQAETGLLINNFLELDQLNSVYNQLGLPVTSGVSYDFVAKVILCDMCMELSKVITRDDILNTLVGKLTLAYNAGFTTEANGALQIFDREVGRVVGLITPKILINLGLDNSEKFKGVTSVDWISLIKERLSDFNITLKLLQKLKLLGVATYRDYNIIQAICIDGLRTMVEEKMSKI